VFRFRGTARLRKRLRVKLPAEEPETTTVLGDWYGNLLHFGRLQLVLCVSEKTLLPVVLPARGLSRGLLDELRIGAGAVLGQIGIPADSIKRELEEMGSLVHGKAVNRSVLGSMNDLAVGMEARLAGQTHVALLDLALGLGETLCSPLGYDSPTRVTSRLFQEAGRQRTSG